MMNLRHHKLARLHYNNQPDLDHSQMPSNGHAKYMYPHLKFRNTFRNPVHSLCLLCNHLNYDRSHSNIDR